MNSASIAAQRLGGGRRAAPRKDETSGGWRRRVLLQVPRVKPLKILAVGAFSIALVSIVANAVVFQKGRHPAPLLGPGQVVTMDQPNAVQHDIAEPTRSGPPPARTGAVAPTSPDVTGTAGPSDAALDALPSAQPSRVQKHAATKPPRGDAIGDLLKSRTGSVAADGLGVAAQKPDPTLIAAQKKLAKLGYAVKPDGRMGAGMRKAMAQFAHDHHLKSEAAMTARLRREIAAATPGPEASTKAE